MTPEDQAKFEEGIVNQVQRIVDAQSENNKNLWGHNEANWKAFNARIEETIPRLLGQFMPKNDFLLVLFLNIVNGVSVGLSIYAALHYFG